MSIWILTVLSAGLAVAVLADLSTRRIPNWLTFGVAMTCLGLQAWFGQWDGLLFGLEGLLLGLLLLLPSYIFGALGAGDVKLMAAVGAALGPWAVFIAVLLTIVAGGLIALVYIGFKGGLGALLNRYIRMFLLLIKWQPKYLTPAANEAAALRFPYALAIACGTAVSVGIFSN